MVQLFNLWPTHRKYFYNTDQQMLMFLMTAPTNFIGLPTSIYLYRIEHYFEAFISFFTVLTSFMYHAVDSLDAKFIIQDAQWHRLDNIGAITAFMISAVHLMDNRDQKLDLQLQIGCLFVAILAQEIDPWDLKYTLFPILAAVIMLLGVLKFRARKPQYNKNMLGKSLFFVFLAACCFGIGLDDKNDYLRIFHGLWHMFLSMASFYFWQLKIVEGEEFGWTNFWKKKVTPDMFYYDVKKYKYEQLKQ